MNTNSNKIVIPTLVIFALISIANALICYNCTDCSAKGAQISKITCNEKCFVIRFFSISTNSIFIKTSKISVIKVGIDNQKRVNQKCYDDVTSGYKMYHTCDHRDFCNINIFNQIKFVDSETNTTEPLFNSTTNSNVDNEEAKSTPRDNLYYIVTTNQQQQANQNAYGSTILSTLVSPATTTAAAATASSDTSTVVTKQYYYIDMNAYPALTTTTRGYYYGCGGATTGYYQQTVTTLPPCQTITTAPHSSASIVLALNQFVYSVLVFAGFCLIVL